MKFEEINSSVQTSEGSPSSFLKRLNQKGMTLIEIMIVVAIIGVMATVATVNFMESLAEAKVKATIDQMHTIEGALEQYKLRSNGYPSTEQGLDALVTKPTTGKVPDSYPDEGYIRKKPKDGWGKDLIYYSPGLAGHAYEIISLGADGVEGGEKYDADIKNYELP